MNASDGILHVAVFDKASLTTKISGSYDDEKSRDISKYDIPGADIVNVVSLVSYS